MTWLIFVAASLACFRLTRLITDDKVTDWLRRDVSKAGQKASQGIRCPFCVSFYFALVVAAYLKWIGIIETEMLPLWIPAIWGGSVLWNQVFVKLSGET